MLAQWPIPSRTLVEGAALLSSLSHKNCHIHRGREPHRQRGERGPERLRSRSRIVVDEKTETAERIAERACVPDASSRLQGPLLTPGADPLPSGAVLRSSGSELLVSGVCRLCQTRQLTDLTDKPQQVQLQPDLLRVVGDVEPGHAGLLENHLLLTDLAIQRGASMSALDWRRS